VAGTVEKRKKGAKKEKVPGTEFRNYGDRAEHCWNGDHLKDARHRVP
jgi:hypothetical protein